MSQRSRRLRGALIILGVTLALLILLETQSARFLPQIKPYSALLEHFGDPYPATYSDYLPFTLPANVTLEGGFGHIALNAFGYRGPAPAQLEKPAGILRLLLLGDSFTLGWGVPEEDSLAGRLRAALADHNPPVEIINAAYHAAYSPDAYHAYLRREGIALAPDVVVLLPYAGNDLSDMADNVWLSTDDYGAPLSLRTTRTYADYRGRVLDPASLPWNYQVPLLRESRLFLGLTNALTDAVNAQSGPAAPTSEQLLAQFRTVTEATIRFCADHDIALYEVLFTVPGVNNASNAPMAAVTADVLAPDTYRVLYDTFNESHQIPNDGHLNARGHALLAEAVLGLIAPSLEP